MAGDALTFAPVGVNVLLANVFTSVTKRFSSVNVNAMETGLHAIKNTADLDWAVNGGLLQHKFAADIIALDVNHGATRAFDRLGVASDSNN